MAAKTHQRQKWHVPIMKKIEVMKNNTLEINKTYALLYFCYLQLFKGGITV